LDALRLNVRELPVLVTVTVRHGDTGELEVIAEPCPYEAASAFPAARAALRPCR
jgi:hypothetical protein